MINYIFILAFAFFSHHAFSAECRKADILFAIDTSSSIVPSQDRLTSYLIPKAKTVIDKVQQLRAESWYLRKGQWDGDFDIRVAAFAFSDKIISETPFEYQPETGGLVRTFLDELPSKITTYKDSTELSLPFEHTAKKFKQAKASINPYDRHQILIVITDALPFTLNATAPPTNPYGSGNIYKDMDRSKRFLKSSVNNLKGGDVEVIAVPVGNWTHEEGAMSIIDERASEDLSKLYDRIDKLLGCFA